MTHGTMYGPNGQVYEVDFELDVDDDTRRIPDDGYVVPPEGWKQVTIQLKAVDGEALNRLINEVSGTWGARDQTDRHLINARGLHEIPGTAASGVWVGRRIFPGHTWRPASDRELRFARAAADGRYIEIIETVVFGVYIALWRRDLFTVEWPNQELRSHRLAALHYAYGSLLTNKPRRVVGFPQI